MMIFFKIIAILIATGAGLLQIGLEYRWHDKRTNRHKQVRSLLIFLMVVGFLAASILVVWDDRQSEKQIQTLTALKSSAETAAKDFEKRELKAIEDREKIKVDLNALQTEYNRQVLEERIREEAATQQRKQLENQIEGLRDKLEPFVRVATARFPDQHDERSALSKLANELRTLESRTKKIETEKEREKIQSTYRQPNPSLRNLVINRLRAIIEKHNNLVINIECEMGNRQRLRVVNDLVAMIKEANIPVNRISSQSFFRKPPPPIRATFNPDDEVLFHNVISSFNGYLGGEITRTRRSDTPRGTIKLKFYGEPVFFTNTGVEFH